jgi:hypothetical protein
MVGEVVSTILYIIALIAILVAISNMITMR